MVCDVTVSGDVTVPANGAKLAMSDLQVPHQAS